MSIINVHNFQPTSVFIDDYLVRLWFHDRAGKYVLYVSNAVTHEAWSEDYTTLGPALTRLALLTECGDGDVFATNAPLDHVWVTKRFVSDNLLTNWGSI